MSKRHEWCVLIHQIPPKPLYLRAKVRQRLAKAGAVALKNSVYVLPRSDETLEDFEWIAQEIATGGGSAWICGGELLFGTSDREMVAKFHREREPDYAAIREELDALLKRFERRSSSVPPEEDGPAILTSVREKLDEIRSIDFFGSPAGKEVATMLQSLEKKLSTPKARVAPVASSAEGKLWVTRRGLKIDRIASSWLIRRFIDPGARFRFVDAREWSKQEGELAFDIVGGDYTHEEDRCSFETIVRRFRLRDSALGEIAEIVHDIDLKDGKFARGDALGIQLLIEGIIASNPSDEERLERGFALFDDLHRSLASQKRTSQSRAKSAGPAKPVKPAKSVKSAKKK